eukprot:2237797-Prymnesium_polylepis.1
MSPGHVPSRPDGGRANDCQQQRGRGARRGERRGPTSHSCADGRGRRRGGGERVRVAVGSGGSAYGVAMGASERQQFGLMAAAAGV